MYAMVSTYPAKKVLGRILVGVRPFFCDIWFLFVLFSKERITVQYNNIIARHHNINNFPHSIW